ncbi:MAG: pyridoxal phosphate-dependent aminotransferase family protein [Flavobacteriaceae bacterium]
MQHNTDIFPGRYIPSNGRKYLYFGGTAYLGLQTDPEFQGLLQSQITKYGSNYGASRKSNVQLAIYGQTEAHLAQWVGSGACTTLSSGYMAAQLVRYFFEREGHTLFYAPNSHVAMHSIHSVPFDSYGALGAALKEYLGQGPTKAPVVLLDSVGFTPNAYPHFTGLKSLPLDQVIVVADDSHGIGILGEHGKGSFQPLKQLVPKELIVCTSLGKGLALQAGAIFGSQSRISQLTDTALFGGASPAAPALLATLRLATSLIAQKRTILQENIARFKERFNHPKIRLYTIPGHPAFSFHTMELAAHLEENGILITHFGYPENQSDHVSRIVLSAHHTKADIETLTKVLNLF